LEADLTKRLSVGLAGRYETYNTFGDTVVGKANAIYKFSDAFSLRGTIGTGFHAPSPGQNNDEILTTNFIAGNQVQTGTYPVNNPIAQFYGAKPLRPEKSTNYGVGFIAKPLDRLTLTVDGYIIDVTSRIGISQNYNVTADNIIAQPALAAVGVDGNVNFFTNGFSTVTRGVDVVATYNANIGNFGRLNATLAYNYNKSSAYNYIDSKGVSFISDAQRVDIAHLAPNHRIILSGNLTHGKFTINARENFYSDWQDPVDYPVYDAATGKTRIGQRFGSKFTSDLDVSYALTEHAALTVGAQNLFNTYPDRIAQSPANAVYPVTGSTADGQIYPRSGGPFGINGGFWYAKVKINY